MVFFFIRFCVFVCGEMFQKEQNCVSLLQLVSDCFMSVLGCCRLLHDVSFVLGCATLLGFFRLFLAANCVCMFWGCSDGF